MGDIIVSLFVLIAFLALSVALALPFIMAGMFLVGLGFRVCGKYDVYLAYKRKLGLIGRKGCGGRSQSYPHANAGAMVNRDAYYSQAYSHLPCNVYHRLQD